MPQMLTNGKGCQDGVAPHPWAFACLTTCLLLASVTLIAVAGNGCRGVQGILEISFVEQEWSSLAAGAKTDLIFAIEFSIFFCTLDITRVQKKMCHFGGKTMG